MKQLQSLSFCLPENITNPRAPKNIKISNSNLYKDIKKSKVSVAAKKLREINPSTKIKTYKSRLNKNNIKNIIKDYEIIIDGSDNFKTKFLLNEFANKLKKKSFF